MNFNALVGNKIVAILLSPAGEALTKILTYELGHKSRTFNFKVSLTITNL